MSALLPAPIGRPCPRCALRTAPGTPAVPAHPRHRAASAGHPKKLCLGSAVHPLMVLTPHRRCCASHPAWVWHLPRAPRGCTAPPGASPHQPGWHPDSGNLHGPRRPEALLVTEPPLCFIRGCHGPCTPLCCWVSRARLTPAHRAGELCAVPEIPAPCQVAMHHGRYPRTATAGSHMLRQVATRYARDPRTVPAAHVPAAQRGSRAPSPSAPVGRGEVAAAGLAITRACARSSRRWKLAVFRGIPSTARGRKAARSGLPRQAPVLPAVEPGRASQRGVSGAAAAKRGCRGAGQAGAGAGWVAEGRWGGSHTGPSTARGVSRPHGSAKRPSVPAGGGGLGLAARWVPAPQAGGAWLGGGLRR